MKRYGFGIAAGVLMLVILGFYSYQSARPTFAAHYHTKGSPTVKKTLPDGSWLKVESNSAVELRFYERIRKAELVAGSALFSIQPDRQRPFYLRLGGVKVSIPEGRVLVRHTTEIVEVVVVEGVAQVQVGRWWPEQHTVESGQQFRWAHPIGVFEEGR